MISLAWAWALGIAIAGRVVCLDGDAFWRRCTAGALAVTTVVMAWWWRRIVKAQI